MANVTMNIDTICKLRRRQQQFAMPSFRATPISPYPEFTPDQLNMRRKFEILQYPSNKMASQTNSLTQRQQFAKAITGKYQGQSYTTTYTDTIDYTFDERLNMDIPSINRISSLAVVDCSNDDLIPTLSTSSDVPGPAITIYKDPTVPLYNYANSSDENYAITDFIDESIWKTTTIQENTVVTYKKMLRDEEIIIEEANDTTMLSLYITDRVKNTRSVYSMQIPISFYFKGTYKGSIASEFKNITLKLSNTSLNPQVVFIDAPVPNTDLISEFLNTGTNVAEVLFDVPANGQDFEGSLYAGMLSITNINLLTEPSYIYDLNIKPDIEFDHTSNTEFLNDYDFEYGLYLNATDSGKKEDGCSIESAPSSNELLPIYVTETTETTETIV